MFISFLQQLSSAALTLQANDHEDVVVDVKRDAEYRNAQFSSYICRVHKAIELVTSKLNVSFKESNYTS